ncbi:MAG: succinate dehydrogenase, hydrophobic membrane anchor protein [Gammaproteobacteria bacterium]|nr:succinate dehydrogenase, hydrophobic membrane anchor protein [Gammaproteobacteria bacterium]
MSLRAPLGKVLGLGTAKDGTEHWWAQRVTAVALLLLGVWFLLSLAKAESLRYADVVILVGRPVNSVLMILLCATLAYHSYLGIQVVIEDYVHAPGLKVVSLLLSRFVHIFLALLSMYSVLRIGLSA